MSIRRSDTGFTLVELMISLVILSATLGIAFSMMLAYQDAVTVQRREIAVVQQASRAMEDMVDQLRSVNIVTTDEGEPNYIRFQIPVNPDGEGYVDDKREIRWGTVYAGEVLPGGWCAWRFVPKMEGENEAVLDEAAIGYDIDLNGSATDVFVIGRIQATYYESDDLAIAPVGTLDLTQDIVIQVKDDPDPMMIFTGFGALSPSLTVNLAVVDPETSVPLVIELRATVEFENCMNDI
jgi:prepilin-type N-terminal cleavage/methylation domain-containing protein